MKENGTRRLLLLLLAVGAISAGPAGTADPRSDAAKPPPADQATRAADAPVPDSALGFVGASVFSVPAPPRFQTNASDPGEGPRLPRAYPGSPPRVPHGIVDFLPIKPGENQCLDCHDAARAAESGAVALPASHYRDLRRAPETARKEVAGARFVCVSCHVTTTDAPVLVGSRFGGPPPAR